MALARTVVDGQLKSDILAPAEEVERAERGRGIRPELRTNETAIRQELARFSLSACAQPEDAKARRNSSRVPMRTMFTGSPGKPSPVVV